MRIRILWNTSTLDSRDALGASLEGGDVGGDPGGRAGGHGELPELRLVHLVEQLNNVSSI